jgi:hypothetical protein
VPLKVLIALLLILNHSVMFGTMTAAEMPDEEHPYGQAVNHENLHHHAHHDDHHSDYHDHQVASGDIMEPGHHDENEPHHEHGVHIHLNMDLPQTISIDLLPQGSQAVASYHLVHQSQTYSPPVPPPNR